VTPHETVANAITFLFVPGDRPDRFESATSSGADVVIIDLEDGVTPGAEEQALHNAMAALSRSGGLSTMVRVRPTGTRFFTEQVDALCGDRGTTPPGLMGLMLAKAGRAADAGELRERLPNDLALIALIESANGVASAAEIAAVPGVTRLAFGALDFSLDIGAEPLVENLVYPRTHLVISSRVGGIAAPLESPSLEIERTDVTEAAARRARSSGFGGMLCIHPGQLAAVRRGFTPTEADVEWARSVLEGEGGAAQIDGKMVDRPITERARQVLRRLS
jgi:citrate lyase subunit beta/citryl-CoA lyase